MCIENICYVYAGPFVTTDIGIQKKIIDQAKVIEQENLPISILVITHSKKPDIFSKTIQFIELPRFNWIKRQLFICKAILNISHNYKTIIIRGLAYSPIFYYYFRNLKSTLILEIHTKVFHELLLHKRYLNYIIQRLSLGFCNSIINKKITVTNEIKEYESSFGFPKETIHVISNGIKTDLASPIPFKPFCGNQLDMVCIASNFQPWHGLDRIINSINAYSGSLPINLHLIGHVNHPDLTLKKPIHQIICYGPIYDQTKINEIFTQSNIAIGAQSLHKKRIFEACSLKTREYALKGIPFIYAYNDTDIPNEEPFCLKIPNDDSLISIECIINFIKKLHTNSIDISHSAHAYAKKHMSWESKLMSLIKTCS